MKSLKKQLFQNIPIKLYKYYQFNEYSRNVLINKKIWASTIDALNDPFEGVSQIKSKFIDDKKTSKLNLRIAGKHYSDPINSDFFKFFTILRAQPEKIGLYCMSESPYNELMWAYYSTHNGFCVEFTLNPKFRSNNVCVRKVKYRKQKHSSYAKCNKNQVLCFDTLIFTKGKKWAHEKEWRILYKKGNKEYLFPGKLSKVIFGCKASEGNIKNTMCILGDSVLYEKINVIVSSFGFKSKKINTADFGLSQDTRITHSVIAEPQSAHSFHKDKRDAHE